MQFLFTEIIFLFSKVNGKAVQERQTMREQFSFFQHFPYSLHFNITLYDEVGISFYLTYICQSWILWWPIFAKLDPQLVYSQSSETYMNRMLMKNS